METKMYKVKKQFYDGYKVNLVGNVIMLNEDKAERYADYIELYEKSKIKSKETGMPVNEKKRVDEPVIEKKKEIENEIKIIENEHNIE